MSLLFLAKPTSLAGDQRSPAAWRQASPHSRSSQRSRDILASGTLLAENRFFIDETPIIAGASDQTIPLLFDNDQEVFGYSFALRVDPAKLAIQEVAFAGTAAETAEFLHGSQDPVDGTAAYGVVFETDEGITETQLPPGTDRVIGLLTVEVLATDDTTVDVTFESVLLPNVSPLPVSNVMTVVEKNQAISVFPRLVDGTVPIESRAPDPTGDDLSCEQSSMTFPQRRRRRAR